MELAQAGKKIDKLKVVGIFLGQHSELSVILQDLKKLNMELNSPFIYFCSTIFIISLIFSLL